MNQFSKIGLSPFLYIYIYDLISFDHHTYWWQVLTLPKLAKSYEKMIISISFEKMIISIYFFQYLLKKWSFWGPFWDQIGPREAKMNPRGPSRASKSQKPSFSKTFKNPLVFYRFLATEASQESLKRPKMAPKRHPKNPRPQKIGIQNWDQNSKKDWNQFLNPL